MDMNSQTKKSSSKTHLFWSRFEKSGSIKAYLKFQEAKLAEDAAFKRAQPASKRKALVKPR